MEIQFDDIITISFTQRCDGKIMFTNIEQIARDNGIYSKEYNYIPSAVNVGYDTLPEGFYAELIGKEAGAKGTVLVPPELAYGKRSNDKIHSINKKEIKGSPKIGEVISNPDYGKGTIVKRIGSEFIVDFNHELAGKEIEYEYEIHDIITDPAEQFFHLLERVLVCEYEAAFEKKRGIISVTISTPSILSWHLERANLANELFERHPSLDTLEFREEYDNVYHTTAPSEADDTTESEEIKAGDLLFFNFIKRFGGKAVETNIEQLARDYGIYYDGYTYEPAAFIMRSELGSGSLYTEFIGKKVGAKGTVILPPEEAYGLRSKEKVCSMDRKELPKDIKVGSFISDAEHGTGLVINKIGKRFIVDFNDLLAGKDIEYEYEILKRITDPTEKFYELLQHLNPMSHGASFENGKGIICMSMPLADMDKWTVKKIVLVVDMLKNFPFLEILETREKYTDDSDDDRDAAALVEEQLRASLQKIIDSRAS